jgi:hypothetical protein
MAQTTPGSRGHAGVAGLHRLRRRRPGGIDHVGAVHLGDPGRMARQQRLQARAVGAHGAGSSPTCRPRFSPPPPLPSS